MRPPWALSELPFLEACTKCDECISVCPESIIKKGGGGFPVVDFSGGECTFCKACVESCEYEAFTDPTFAGPWSHTAVVLACCLPRKGIACQSCQDSCEVGAISFTPRLGGPSLPDIDTDTCTGCGACFAVCPSSAINFNQLEQAFA